MGCISANYDYFLEILDKAHFCNKGVHIDKPGKFSFQNNDKTLICSYCEISIDCSNLKIFNDPPIQYDENINSLVVVDDHPLNSPDPIEKVYIPTQEIISSIPSTSEKDPLSLENKELNKKSGIFNKNDNSVKKIPKLVNWYSESIENITDIKSIKRQKYPLTLVCEYCGIHFQGKDRIYKLFYHRNKIHRKNVQFICPICKKIYWGERELALHYNLHTNPGAICEVCGLKFSRKQDLIRHGLVHEDKQFHCTFCSKKFRRKDHLKVHERLHTGSFPHLCKKCGSGFPQKVQLALHRKKCPYLKLDNKKSLSEII